MADVYDSEAMAADIADAVGEVFGSAGIGEMFTSSFSGHGHAFLVDTPGGQRFKVAVTEVAAG